MTGAFREPAGRLRKRLIRARVINVKKMPKHEIAINRVLEPELDHWRPSTRAECQPCPICQEYRDQTNQSTESKIWKTCGVGAPVCTSRKGHVLVDTMRLWNCKPNTSGEPKERGVKELRLCVHEARDVWNPRVQGLVLNAGTMSESEDIELQALRRPRDIRAPELGIEFQQLLSGHGDTAEQQAFVGPDQYQRKLRTNELPMGNMQRTVEKPQKRREPNRRWSYAHCTGLVGTDGVQQKCDSRETPEGLGRLRCGHDPQKAIGSRTRPCVFVSCRHHLYLDVSPDTGAIKLNFPDLEVWEMGESCSLDVADREGATLEDVGAILNVTRERVRQLEVMALAEFEAKGGVLREFASPGSHGKREGKEWYQKHRPKPRHPRETVSPELRAQMRAALKYYGVTQARAAYEMGLKETSFTLWLNYKTGEIRKSATATAVLKWLKERAAREAACPTA